MKTFVKFENGFTKGTLTVVSECKVGVKNGYLIKCSCGKEYWQTHYNFKRLTGKGCKRCVQKTVSFKHGFANTNLSSVWRGMRSRCLDPNHKSYNYYGERGIEICEEWKNDMPSFCRWAIENGYKKGLSLDRINNNGSYSPDNCRWATVKEQNNNTRVNKFLEINGVSKTITQWAEEYGLTDGIFKWRLRKGLDPMEALKRPKRSGRDLTLPVY